MSCFMGTPTKIRVAGVVKDVSKPIVIECQDFIDKVGVAPYYFCLPAMFMGVKDEDIKTPADFEEGLYIIPATGSIMLYYDGKQWCEVTIPMIVDYIPFDK